MLSMSRKAKTDWRQPSQVRKYHRDWARMHRASQRQVRAEEPDDLLQDAFERARGTHVPLPRDPVLDAWRVQRVLRVAFDDRYGIHRVA